ncbi:YjjG family noncanonical pyrimidine nucleotidase [Anaerotignum sp. MB30-C6]|uniref:YjjG family noncanonical pyrimidine nucleotidase n=1 Tax=Anaerotignum sp. MB30-C6 TaxID=3070814 RepID=UPI0027DBB8F4|nr:YjjG family noncanonical pyrimidine nucleotidase [Anaerotignum sp. MB30-C6]WMI80416.1 YjjG family noncanonical pyrimidine nucleotidase [Anaerotignum sp. MB30-C6]
MKKKFLLFDVDHTLLDFSTSEKKALKKCFDDFGISLTEEILSWYLDHNHKLWTNYENGIITRDAIFKTRFADTFAQFSINAHGDLMESTYREALSQGSDLIENALHTIQKLSTTHELYIVTNGLASTQEKRLKDSGLAPYFKDTFVSEIMGSQKPMIEYFDYVFNRIPDFEKKEALIIGDSLSSDIQGGIRSGIDTCWFNPEELENHTKFQPTYEIHSLLELLPLLETN